MGAPSNTRSPPSCHRARMISPRMRQGSPHRDGLLAGESPEVSPMVRGIACPSRWNSVAPSSLASRLRRLVWAGEAAALAREPRPLVPSGMEATGTLPPGPRAGTDRTAKRDGSGRKDAGVRARPAGADAALARDVHVPSSSHVYRPETTVPATPCRRGITRRHPSRRGCRGGSAPDLGPP